MSTAPSTIAVPTGSGTALTLNEGQQAAATSHCFVTAYDTITNPSSSMTRPADANAYSVGDLIANSVTAGSVAVPSFTIANSGGGVLIPRIRLYSLVYAGWDGIAIQVGLWAANHPTYVNGDNGAYSIATQSQSWLIL